MRICSGNPQVPPLTGQDGEVIPSHLEAQKLLIPCARRVRGHRGGDPSDDHLVLPAHWGSRNVQRSWSPAEYGGANKLDQNRREQIRSRLDLKRYLLYRPEQGHARACRVQEERSDHRGIAGHVSWFRDRIVICFPPFRCTFSDSSTCRVMAEKAASESIAGVQNLLVQVGRFLELLLCVGLRLLHQGRRLRQLARNPSMVNGDRLD